MKKRRLLPRSAPAKRKRGAPPGNRNAFKHGKFTREIYALRRDVRAHILRGRALIAELEAGGVACSAKAFRRICASRATSGSKADAVRSDRICRRLGGAEPLLGHPLSRIPQVPGGRVLRQLGSAGLLLFHERLGAAGGNELRGHAANQLLAVLSSISSSSCCAPITAFSTSRRRRPPGSDKRAARNPRKNKRKLCAIKLCIDLGLHLRCRVRAD